MTSRTLIIALAAGALVSTGLLALEPFTHFDLLALEWPGISAAYLFWGAVGGSAVAGIAIAWLVNALVYGAAAFAALTAVRLGTTAFAKKATCS